MAVIENGKAVLKDLDGKLKLVPEAQAAEAADRFGWQLATEEDVAQDDLQKSHGGEKLETALGSAQEQAAKRLSQVSQFAGDVDAMGNPIDTVEPVAPETVAGIVPGLAGANDPELAAQQQANPISAGLGKAAADLPLYAAAGAATGGLGAGVASGLGAGEALAGLAGAATANVALSTGQEAESAHEEHRPIDVENIGKNIAFGALLEGGGYAGAKALGAIFGKAKPIQQAVEDTLSRAGTAADDLGNPSVLARARAETRVKIEEAASAIEEAANSVHPVVGNNVYAQKTAMRQVRDALPDLYDDLDELSKRPRSQRYQGLLDLRDQATTPEALEALDKLINDRAIWGAAAVDHANTMQALGAARATGPEAIADAARGLKDPTVEKLLGELDAHFEDMHRYDAAEAFTPRRSVGAAGDGPELMPAEEVSHYVRNDPEIVDQMRTVAGGGEGEKGAFQDFNESFREVTANRVKREDFVAAAPTDDATRSALLAERDDVANALHEVTSTLGERGARKKVALLNEHIRELREAPVEEVAGVLDRTKQVLDDLHMKAIVDRTDPYGEVLEAVDPVVERIRGTLENPAYVGDKIAELQQVRNDAWSNRETGFIHNMQVANETGVKLFKRIGRDYHTGDLVMQFDPGSFKSLIGLDWHDSKPVLEAWSKVLDSAERMAANTVEVGAKSAGRTPIGRLQKSIEQIRQVFETQSKRLAARDMARGGLEALGRAESLPFAGKLVSGAKALLGKERVESLAAGAGSRYVEVPNRTIEGASAALRRSRGEAPPIAPRLEPTPSPSGPGTGPGVAAARPSAVELADVSGGMAANDAAERAAAARRQAGGIVIQGEASPKIDRLATKLKERLDAYEKLADAPSPTGAVDELGGNDVAEAHAERLDKARGKVTDALDALKGEYDSAISDVTGAGFTAPDQLKPRARAKYDRLVAGRDELQGVIEAHSEKLSDSHGDYLHTDVPAAAKKYLAGRSTIDTEAGSVEMAAGDFARGLATSPLGAVTGAGALGLAAHKGYQFLDDPEQGADDGHAAYLADAGSRDTLATARALTDPAVASDFARRSRGQPSTLEQFQGDHETLQQAFTAQRAMVEKAMRDPAAMVDALADSFGDLSPELRDKLSAKALQIATYQYNELPPQRGVSVTRPQGLPPHPLEARSYALKAMTAQKPTTAFDDAKRGTLRHEQLDALKACWPELHTELRSQTLTAMTSGKSTIQQRQRADLLFGFASALDPAFSTRLSAAAAAGRQAQPQASGGAPSAAPSKSRVTANLQPDGLAALAQ